jgi:hypothetical protein
MYPTVLSTREFVLLLLCCILLRWSFLVLIIPRALAFDVPLVNGKSLASDEIYSITFIEPLIFSLIPSFGPLYGKTTISIYGLSPLVSDAIYLSYLACRFTFDDFSSFLSPVIQIHHNLSHVCCLTPTLSHPESRDIHHAVDAVVDIGFNNAHDFVT